MIYGIGIDNIEVSRIKKQIDNSENFKQKIFTENEIEYCESQRNYAESYAVRFAAKEAFLKAIGTGLRDGLKFIDIEIMNDKNGKPEINLFGNAEQLRFEKKLHRIHLSLTHLKKIATAFLIIEK